MIAFHAIASSSSGNCYLVSDGHFELLIEAGIRYPDLRIALNHHVTQLSGVLVSHSHGDHCKAVKDVMKAGVDVYASETTLSEIGLGGHRAIAIEAGKQFSVGAWNVYPFDLRHDVETLGFLLTNRAGEKLVYISDSYYCPYAFSGLTHIAVECNYSLDILDANIAAASVPTALRSRLLRSHFSLEHVKEFLRANDLSKVVEIHLLHLSSGNSDEERFKREIAAATGKPVFVAGK